MTSEIVSIRKKFIADVDYFRQRVHYVDMSSTFGDFHRQPCRQKMNSFVASTNSDRELFRLVWQDATNEENTEYWQ